MTVCPNYREATHGKIDRILKVIEEYVHMCSFWE